MPLRTAVLFLVFNRPETTAQVFEVIRRVKPTRLYVAADGPRSNQEDEEEKVEKVRQIITTIDWPCEIRTLFREKNLGCKYAVSEAISWFFDHEEKGIILEDDCLPSQSFFSYCETMLEKYSQEESIWMINGYNPRYPNIKTKDFFLSQNPSVWGWATWKRCWEKYDVDMSLWDPKVGLKFFENVPKYVYKYYYDIFNKTKNGQIDTWDCQLAFLILKNDGYVVKPYANLISNIGINGTHSSQKDINHFVELGEFIQSQSDNCIFDPEEDFWFYKTRIKNLYKSFLFRVFTKIFNFFQR